MPHKLLLADDSVTIQRVIELTFADEDITVIAVGDGRQAIDRARTERPDIVLADVGMPERDGYEVAAFIKNTPELAHIPVLLLTGAFEPIDEGRAKAAGCDGVLVKPFEPQMVINRVKDLIAGKRPLAAASPAALTASPGASVEPSPQPAASPSVEDYFDRLDAAFSLREAATADAPPRRQPGDDLAAPGPAAPAGAAGLASELANWEPAESETAGSSVAAAPVIETGAARAVEGAAASTDALPTLAEAFAALLSAERGRTFAPSSINRDGLGEAVIELVTRRVIERMTDRAVREVVLDVAERLVREEIERIKEFNKA
ncbi:MAG TPA: response regulator [Vicinamibacterales bacterium]|nr:response regulator [Vicinamibacterales bacterium]